MEDQTHHPLQGALRTQRMGHGRIPTGCLPNDISTVQPLLRPLIDAHFCLLPVPISEILSRWYPLWVKLLLESSSFRCSSFRIAANRCLFMTLQWMDPFSPCSSGTFDLFVNFGKKTMKATFSRIPQGRAMPLDSGPVCKTLLSALHHPNSPTQNLSGPSPAEKSSLALRRQSVFLTLSLPCPSLRFSPAHNPLVIRPFVVVVLPTSLFLASELYNSHYIECSSAAPHMADSFLCSDPTPIITRICPCPLSLLS